AGLSYRNEGAFRLMLDDRPSAAQLDLHLSELLETALTEASPKFHLWPGAGSVTIADNAGAEPWRRDRVRGQDVAAWGDGLAFAEDRRLLIDPARGRLVVPGGLAAGDAVFAQHYHFGLTHWVGAGPCPHVADLSPDDEVTGELPSGAVDADGFFTDP